MICEINTSGSSSLQPLGQTHIWIGSPSAVFFNLPQCYSTVILGSAIPHPRFHGVSCHRDGDMQPPSQAGESTVNGDTGMRCQCTVHRVPEANISADLISAVLSQGPVSLKQVLTIQHECTEGGSSPHGLLSNLPSSTACLRTECNGGNFTVISAWPV
jgi:hypothetical protein